MIETISIPNEFSEYLRLLNLYEIALQKLSAGRNDDADSASDTGFPSEDINQTSCDALTRQTVARAEIIVNGGAPDAQGAAFEKNMAHALRTGISLQSALQFAEMENALNGKLGQKQARRIVDCLAQNKKRQSAIAGWFFDDGDEDQLRDDRGAAEFIFQQLTLTEKNLLLKLEALAGDPETLPGRRDCIKSDGAAPGSVHTSDLHSAAKAFGACHAKTSAAIGHKVEEALWMLQINIDKLRGIQRSTSKTTTRTKRPARATRPASMQERPVVRE